MDVSDAARLLKEELRLPEWVASISVSEADDSEAIIIRVERQYALRLRHVPKTFEGYPVVVEIRSTRGTH